MVEHTRTLDFKVAFAIGLGTMIAAGIFSLSGIAVARVGSSAVISFVIAALVAGITAASYSEFASIYSENGGGYLFSSRTFDSGSSDRLDILVYFIGASLFLGYTGTTAFYLATMDEWFFKFIIPSSLHALPRGSVGVLAAALLGALNARGTEESGSFQLIVTSAKVVVLLVFIGGIVSTVGPSNAATEFVDAFGRGAESTAGHAVDILTVAALAFITFFGFSAIAASAGEIIEPRKTVPKAIAASIVTVSVLYTLVIVAMVNSPVPAEVVAEQGETAMGTVASAALGQFGFWLIVAGAVFSMVSASNASVLAASGIGSLMGRQGHAPRRFSRIHRRFDTPFWSVSTATATIVALIVAFITVLGNKHGLVQPHIPFTIPLPDVSIGIPLVGSTVALAPIDLAFNGLGLTTLTGFATLNLLVPLSLVNLALIYSRRNKDIDRPFEVPLVPLLPILGIVANLALIYNLPVAGVATGILVILGLLAGYLLWGGAPRMEELFQEVVEPGPEATEPTDRYKVLVPIARPSRAVQHARLAIALGEARDDDPVIQVLNVTEIPEQTPKEMVTETARERTEAVRRELAEAGIDDDVVVEGHTCRDVAFDIVQSARDDDADLIVMGYPEESHDVTEAVEYDAPCDVLFASGLDDIDDLGTVNVGVGGGPHHQAALPLVNALADTGSAIHLIDVEPTGSSGLPEQAGKTLDRLSSAVTATIHNVTAPTIAEGLVSTALENGGVLIVGASRTRRLRQWVFGSTPDRVVNLASEEELPVIVYASSVGARGWFEDRLFPIYRYSRKVLGRRRRGGMPTEQ